MYGFNETDVRITALLYVYSAEFQSQSVKNCGHDDRNSFTPLNTVRALL